MDDMAGHQVVHHSRGASAGEAAIIAVTAALLWYDCDKYYLLLIGWLHSILLEDAAF